MSDLNEKLAAALEQLPPDVAVAVKPLVLAPGFRGQLSADKVNTLVQQTGLPIEQLMQAMLPIAAAYAQVPISEFYVGVWVQGDSGALYAGANQEFSGMSLGCTVHAEQAALTHAWQAGECSLIRLAVNAAPCGHCRQFLNELNRADNLEIHCLGQPASNLPEMLPRSFGPKDLGITSGLLAHQHTPLQLNTSDPLVEQVRQAAQSSYAPYSGDLAAVGLLLDDGSVAIGRYAENAAFNPSMQPLQAALLELRWRGLPESQIKRAVLVETEGASSHQAITTRSLLEACCGLELECFQAKRQTLTRA